MNKSRAIEIVETFYLMYQYRILLNHDLYMYKVSYLLLMLNSQLVKKFKFNEFTITLNALFLHYLSMSISASIYFRIMRKKIQRYNII